MEPLLGPCAVRVQFVSMLKFVINLIFSFRLRILHCSFWPSYDKVTINPRLFRSGTLTYICISF